MYVLPVRTSTLITLPFFEIMRSDEHAEETARNTSNPFERRSAATSISPMAPIVLLAIPGYLLGDTCSFLMWTTRWHRSEQNLEFLRLALNALLQLEHWIIPNCGVPFR